MSIVEKLFGDKSSATRNKTPAGHDRDYIDLSDYAGAEKAPSGEASASTYVRFAQVRALDDLKHFASIVYDGNMLVLDIKAVQSDEILLRRLSNELRKLAQDTGGDVAILGEQHILLTPTGIKVDRRQLTVNKETGEVTEAPVRGGAAPAAPAPAQAPNAPAGPAARSNGTRGARMAVNR